MTKPKKGEQHAPAPCPNRSARRRVAKDSRDRARVRSILLPGIPLGMMEAEKGETITRFIRRSGWNFKLPTICVVDGRPPHAETLVAAAHQGNRSDRILVAAGQRRRVRAGHRPSRIVGSYGLLRRHRQRPARSGGY